MRAVKSIRMQRFQMRLGSMPVLFAMRRASISASSRPRAATAPYEGMTSAPMWKRTGCTKARIGYPAEGRGQADAACPQPAGLKTRTVDAGSFCNFAAGRMGRATRLPPQLGQMPCRRDPAQSRQKVHSYVQIMASEESGDRSRLQHSQLGRNSSMVSDRQK